MAIRATAPTFSQGLVTLQWRPFGHTILLQYGLYLHQNRFGGLLMLTVPGEWLDILSYVLPLLFHHRLSPFPAATCNYTSSDIVFNCAMVENCGIWDTHTAHLFLHFRLDYTAKKRNSQYKSVKRNKFCFSLYKIKSAARRRLIHILNYRENATKATSLPSFLERIASSSVILASASASSFKEA